MPENDADDRGSFPAWCEDFFSSSHGWVWEWQQLSWHDDFSLSIAADLAVHLQSSWNVTRGGY